MLESRQNSANGGNSSHYSGVDSSEEELSVLPGHTKVIVTGNNRTKYVLVGLQGVVKKAMGVGGWHWKDDAQNSNRSRHWIRRSPSSPNRTVSRSFSCDSHSRSISTRGRSNIDLSKLETAALRRYLQHFNLVDSMQNPSKQVLMDIVQRHFMSQQMDELQVIVGFVQAAKRMKTTCRSSQEQ
ncbi:hypothetical protein SAY87_031556 [Trapa incisa]|uniref:Histone deacetylase complex subunit SAP30 Sin3 binding domain-containing protein n=2 Tax=Trapa TaxID=22665 RepID=A0AAN7MHA3_TRANT|nr:hypothetical protein SAY87_031556 [Trapa incisa]KAK4795846.1 hypothetical protein SAY86_028172 [Trapa natans]